MDLKSTLNTPYMIYPTVCLLGFSLMGERGLTQQAIAQLTGDPRYLRFNVLIREDAKGLPFTDVNAKAVLSPQLF